MSLFKSTDPIVAASGDAMPDAEGYFGDYGGRFVAETLIAALDDLNAARLSFLAQDDFKKQLKDDLKDFIGRPTPLYYAERWSDAIGGARLWLKREDLAHTGAHKINNTVGQVRLAKAMGKTRVIAETGAGQHGVATAATAARLGLTCCVYMGERDIERQEPNVKRMALLGAEIIPVTSGSRTLKDALNEAMRDWIANVDNTFYVIGTVAGPHPYPLMVRDFQKIIGEEAREQALMQIGRLPDALIACVGGGSNAIGLFHSFIKDKAVKMFGVEAGGDGIDSQRHAAPLNAGKPGVLHGHHSYLMQTKEGQVMETHSVAAGLDYPSVGPEHAWLRDNKRVDYVAATDKDAVQAFGNLCRLEGIIPALESSHALAYAETLAKTMTQDEVLLLNLSGRGDKDIDSVASYLASV